MRWKRVLLVVGVIVGLTWLFVPGPPGRGALERAYLTQGLSDAKTVWRAAQRYAEDHENRLPQKLEELFPKYLDDRRLLENMILTVPGLPAEHVHADYVVLLRIAPEIKHTRRRMVIYYANGNRRFE